MRTTIFATLLKHRPSEQAGGKHRAGWGVVKVPDERLERLSALFNPRKKVNATIDYVNESFFEIRVDGARGLLIARVLADGPGAAFVLIFGWGI